MPLLCVSLEIRAIEGGRMSDTRAGRWRSAGGRQGGGDQSERCEERSGDDARHDIAAYSGPGFCGSCSARGGRYRAGEVWGTGGDIGFTRDGSHAQFILLPAAAVTTKPAAISMEAAGGRD